MCEAQRVVFGERDNMLENGGWDVVAEQLLDQPMVLSLGIGDDVGFLLFYFSTRYGRFYLGITANMDSTSPGTSGWTRSTRQT